MRENEGITSEEALKQMYRSGIKASYFAGFRDPKFMQKSKLQISKIEDQEEENIDANTFRILKGFKRPSNDFIVYSQKGRCFLQKQSLFSCFGKRRTYDIQLKNSKLSVLSNDKIVRFLDFNVISANVLQQGNSFSFRFQENQRQLFVQPAADAEKWTQQLNKIINQTQGKPKQRTYLCRKSPMDFFKSQHTLNEQFQKCANSGDVMLFKSQHSAATLQRAFTDSEYDHVGIVLRNQKNELFIFESTSQEGVGLTPWKHMIKYEWYDQTDKICWRKLNMDIGQRQIQIIQMFIAKTLGKGFELSLNKLFQFKSAMERTKEEEEGKTYFCSELAARLYKQLGILDESKSSTSYYPVDFSQKGGLRIIKPGVSLSNQIIISFDK